MNEFKKFYLWGMNMKLYMGIYFAAIVFLSGCLVAILGGDSLRLVVLLQMLLVSTGIAILQVWLLPMGVDFARSTFAVRALIWLAIATAVTVATAILGGWFAAMPGWCPWLLGGFMVVGGAAMLFGIKWEQDADTMRLNDALKHYQQR